MEWWEHLGASPKTLLHVFPQSIETIFLEMDKNLFQEHSYLWAYFQKGGNFLKYWCKIGVFGSSALRRTRRTHSQVIPCMLRCTESYISSFQTWRSKAAVEVRLSWGVCGYIWWTVPLDDLLHHRTGRCMTGSNDQHRQGNDTPAVITLQLRTLACLCSPLYPLCLGLLVFWSLKWQ
jgi:hypothetical protein